MSSSRFVKRYPTVIRRPASLACALVVTIAPAVALAQGAAPPAPAQAPTGGEDEVTLKSGGAIRGTVIAADPPRLVVIAIQGTGEQRTIPWADVDRVERAKYARPGITAPLARDTPLPPPAGTAGGPRLHIETDDQSVTLHRITGSIAVEGAGSSAVAISSRPVCAAPCDRVVDPGEADEFFFTGESAPSSSSFRLSSVSGDVTARVHPGSMGRRIGGAWLTMLGATGVLAGGAILGVSAALDDPAFNAKPYVIAGGISLGAGAAMLIGGIALLASSGTSYELVRLTAPRTASIGFRRF
jgi:hypothetical protein